VEPGLAVEIFRPSEAAGEIRQMPCAHEPRKALDRRFVDGSAIGFEYGGSKNRGDQKHLRKNVGKFSICDPGAYSAHSNPWKEDGSKGERPGFSIPKIQEQTPFFIPGSLPPREHRFPKVNPR
jgi:hypothetical protein